MSSVAFIAKSAEIPRKKTPKRDKRNKRDKRGCRELSRISTGEEDGRRRTSLPETNDHVREVGKILIKCDTGDVSSLSGEGSLLTW